MDFLLEEEGLFFVLLLLLHVSALYATQLLTKGLIL